METDNKQQEKKVESNQQIMNKEEGLSVAYLVRLGILHEDLSFTHECWERKCKTLKVNDNTYIEFPDEVLEAYQKKIDQWTKKLNKMKESNTFIRNYNKDE